jgi:hypothetical protein
VISQFIGDGVVMYEQEADGTMNEYNAIPVVWLLKFH